MEKRLFSQASLPRSDTWSRLFSGILPTEQEQRSLHCLAHWITSQQRSQMWARSHINRASILHVIPCKGSSGGSNENLLLRDISCPRKAQIPQTSSEKNLYFKTKNESSCLQHIWMFIFPENPESYGEVGGLGCFFMYISAVTVAHVSKSRPGGRILQCFWRQKKLFLWWTRIDSQLRSLLLL